MPVAPAAPQAATADSPARTQAAQWSAAEKLDYLRRKNIGNCQRCKLSTTRTQIVFGVGDPLDVGELGDVAGVGLGLAPGGAHGGGGRLGGGVVDVGGEDAGLAVGELEAEGAAEAAAGAGDDDAWSGWEWHAGRTVTQARAGVTRSRMTWMRAWLPAGGRHALTGARAPP